jgi:hypothetical protein
MSLSGVPLLVDSSELLLDVTPLFVLHHHKPATAPRKLCPQTTYQPIICGTRPAISTLVFHRHNRSMFIVFIGQLGLKAVMPRCVASFR